MSTTHVTVDQHVSLTNWEFAHTPHGAEPGAWTAVTVPHEALAATADVRSGGQARYRTTITLDRVHGDEVLRFGAVSYACRVSVNGVACGAHEGAWDAFAVAVGPALQTGANEVVVEVDLPDYDPESPFHFRSLLLGFVPDTMGPFAGLWREVSLARPAGIAEESVRVAALGRDALVDWVPADGRVRVDVLTVDGRLVGAAETDAASGGVRVSCTDAPTWTPAQPTLVTVTITHTTADGTETRIKRRAGFRELVADGHWIRLGQERVHLRAVLHWGHYPEFGAPAPTREQARRELELIRELGFNAVKFCLFMAPDFYYELCDELGVLIWQELPLWLPKDDGELERRVLEQYPRLIEQVVAHPSVVLVSLGCELDGTVPTDLLDRAYALVRDRLPDAIVCANSGSGECFGGGEDALSDIDDYHFYGDAHRLEPLIERFIATRRRMRPWLFGEYNDADTWRSASDVIAPSDAPDWLSTDLAVNPLRSVHAGFASDQPIYRQAEIIVEQGYADEVPGLRELSHTQAWATRKLVFELTRRFGSVSGYVVTTLRDVPVTTAGLIDDLGCPKFDAAAFARVNAPATLALTSPAGRRWVHGGDRLQVSDPFNPVAGEAYDAAVVLANATDAHGAGELVVELEANGRTLVVQRIPVDVAEWTSREAAILSFGIPDLGVDRTVAASLTARVEVAGREYAANAWELALHPRERTSMPFLLHDPAGVLAGWEPGGAIRIATPADLAATAAEASVLVTTRYDDSVRRATAELGLRTFAIDDASYFDLDRGPFWRENVKRVHRGGWLDAALPTEHLGEPAMALASDRFVSRRVLSERVPGFRPLVTRYDARTYSVGQYVFDWREGRGHTVYSTLTHGEGTGTQPRSITDNAIGRRLLQAFIDHDHPSTEPTQ